MIGIPNLTKLFQTPETSTCPAMASVLKPYDLYIAYVTPMPIAPPPGSVFATAVDDWLTRAA